MTHGGGSTRSQAIDQAVVDANHAEMQRVLATAVELHQQGKFQHAEQLYRVLIGIDPRHADALHLLGVLTNQSGNHHTAAELIERAVAAKPDVAQFHFNLGVVLQALERSRDAAGAYASAVRLKPDYREAFENLGVALQDCGDDEGAMTAYLNASKLDDTSAIAQQNLGTLLLAKGHIDSARQHFEKALDANPGLADVHYKLSSTHVLQGAYGAGWDAYEWRYCSPSFVDLNPPAFAPYPKWAGTSLEGKTILITSEQGVGDEVLFASCFGDVIDQAEHCIIHCDARLVELYRRSFPAASIRANHASEYSAAIDCRISAGSLPCLLRRDANAFGDRRQYLWSDPDKREAWRDWLRDHDDTLKIGITWRGGLNPKAREARSIELDAWRELLAVDGASFFDIQYGDHGVEVARFNASGPVQLHKPADLDPLHELDDLAAFISALDLVISVDNSTVHFAAALGVPTWVLLPARPEWRWREENGRNPWFATLETFRQHAHEKDDWQCVLARAAQRLRDFGGSIAPVAIPALPVLEGGVDVRARPATPAATKSLLINDTTDWYHYGCTATSLAIHDRLRAKGHAVSAIPMRQIADLHVLPACEADFDCPQLFEKFAQAHPDLVSSIEAADLVYVNGEGTLHRLGHQATALLYLIRIASRHLGKPVRVINHSCYPEGDSASEPGVASRIYSNIFAGLDYIAVREDESAAVMESLGLDVTASFDSLPLFIEHLYAPPQAPESPYVVIAGGVTWQRESLAALAALAAHARKRGLKVKVLGGANAYPAGDDAYFIEALWRECGDELEFAFATSETHWLDIISGASLLVSGRFHHSIAAAFLNTPFIVSQSNTPKITGLLRKLQLDALIATPQNWPDGSADYQRRLLDKATSFLDHPQACLLNDDLRSELLAASRRNFEDPVHPS